MSLRQPTCRINGVPAMEAEILVHRYQSASDFTATLSMTKIEKFGGSVSEWLASKKQVSIVGGDKFGGTKMLIKGQVDAAEANWFDRTIRIQGRDGTAQLIDTTVTPTQDQFKNRTDDDIVQELAGRAGMSVQTGGGGGGGGGAVGAGQKAGRTHVNNEYDHLTGQQSIWEIIRQLGDANGKVAWVDPVEKILHYEKAKSTTSGGGGGGGGGGAISIRYRKPGPGHPEGNFTDLRIITLFPAKEFKVQGATHHNRDNQTYTGEAGGGGEGGGGGSGGGGGGGDKSGDIRVETPGMKQQQIQTLADGINTLAGSHFKRLTYSGPGNTNADVRGSVNVSGTGTSDDGPYDIWSIRWVFDGSGSHFTMTVEARRGNEGGGGGGQ